MIQYCGALESILSLSSPKVLVVEFNPLFPPPISFESRAEYHFTEKFDVKDTWVGCSISKINHVAQKYGYRLLQIDFNDATLVKEKYLNLFGSIPHDTQTLWTIGYYNQSITEEIREKMEILRQQSKIPAYAYSEQLDNWLVDILTSVVEEEEQHSREKRESDEKNKTNVFNSLLKKQQLHADIAFDLQLSRMLLVRLRNFFSQQIGDGTIKVMIENILEDSAANNLGSRRPFKDFCYLVIEEEWDNSLRSKYEPMAILSANSDLIKVKRGENSWSQTRNNLLSEALKREQTQNWRYRYYIFLQDNVELESPLTYRSAVTSVMSRDENTFDFAFSNNRISYLRLFEYGVELYEPAIAGPFAAFPGFSQEGFYVSWQRQPLAWLKRMEPNWLLHPSFFAVHREAVAKLFPLHSELDAKHWFLPHLVLLQKAKMLYPANCFQWMALAIRNSDIPLPSLVANSEDIFNQLRAYFPDGYPARLDGCFNWDAPPRSRLGSVPNGAFQKKKNIYYDSITYYNVHNLYC